MVKASTSGEKKMQCLVLNMLMFTSQDKDGGSSVTLLHQTIGMLRSLVSVVEGEKAMSSGFSSVCA